MPTIAPAHDEHATGPRDWRELAAMRAAHAAMPHAVTIRANDKLRVDELTRAQRKWPAIRAARAAMRDVRDLRRRSADPKNAPPAETVTKVRADAAKALAAARAAIRASRQPWTLGPCPVTAPRCPGHAAMRDPGALRRELRATVRPLRRPQPRSAAA